MNFARLIHRLELVDFQWLEGLIDLLLTLDGRLDDLHGDKALLLLHIVRLLLFLLWFLSSSLDE